VLTKFRIMNDISIKRIDAAIRFFLYVLIFWLPYSSAVVETCVIISLLLWVVKRFVLCWNQRQSLSFSKKGFGQVVSLLKPQSSFLNYPILIFIFFTFMAVVHSRYLGISQHAFITKTLEWFVVYFLVIEAFSRKKHLKIAAGVFLFTTFSTAIDGLFQFYISGKDIFFGYPAMSGRATAGFPHSNALAAYLLIAVPFSLSLFLGSHRLWKRMTYFILFFVISWAFILTFSRGAFFSLFFGFIFFFLCYRPKFIIWLISILVIFLCFYDFLPPSVIKTARLDKASLGGALDWRLGLWTDSLKMIKERPLLGHGLNAYMKLFQKYRRKLKTPKGSFDHMPTYAHNCYIQMWVEVGLLGLMSFLLIIFILFIKTGRAILRMSRKDRNYRLQLVGLLSGVLAFLIDSNFDTQFYSLKLSIYFWFVVGIIISVHRLMEKDKNFVRD